MTIDIETNTRQVTPMTNQIETDEIVVRLSDPGLHSHELVVNSGLELDELLSNALKTSYTRICITIDGKDHWLQRFLGGKTWLPFVTHQALQPYYSPEDV